MLYGRTHTIIGAGNHALCSLTRWDAAQINGGSDGIYCLEAFRLFHEGKQPYNAHKIYEQKMLFSGLPFQFQPLLPRRSHAKEDMGLSNQEAGNHYDATHHRIQSLILDRRSINQ
jgi:hypothetical protein